MTGGIMVKLMVRSDAREAGEKGKHKHMGWERHRMRTRPQMKQMQKVKAGGEGKGGVKNPNHARPKPE